MVMLSFCEYSLHLPFSLITARRTTKFKHAALVSVQSPFGSDDLRGQYSPLFSFHCADVQAGRNTAVLCLDMEESSTIARV